LNREVTNLVVAATRVANICKCYINVFTTLAGGSMRHSNISRIITTAPDRYIQIQQDATAVFTLISKSIRNAQTLRVGASANCEQCIECIVLRRHIAHSMCEHSYVYSPMLHVSVYFFANVRTQHSPLDEPKHARR
jgi:hypothetical protein